MTCSQHFQPLRTVGLGCVGGILLSLQSLPTLAATPNPDNAMGEITPSAIASSQSILDERLLCAVRTNDVEAARVP
jgi:hypothetical protein